MNKKPNGLFTVPFLPIAVVVVFFGEGGGGEGGGGMSRLWRVHNDCYSSELMRCIKFWSSQN